MCGFQYDGEGQKKALHTEGFWKGDTPVLRSNGSQVLPHVVASVVLDDAGQPICLQASFADIADRKRIENQRTQEHYAFNALAELHGAQDIDHDRVLQEFVDILPQCWLYPDITCARLTLGNQNFHTHNYLKFHWKLTALVKVNKSTVGRLEVGYLEKRPDRDDGTFLKKERLLIDRLAERIGRIIEHKQGEEKLQAAYTEETKLRRQLEEEAQNRIRFIDILAHELKWPLTPIFNSSDMLREILPAELTLPKKLADNILHGTHILNNRLDELLDSARSARALTP